MKQIERWCTISEIWDKTPQLSGAATQIQINIHYIWCRSPGLHLTPGKSPWENL